ncbi:MAG: universal stress protein [Chitinophagaceae bacterium]
MKTFIVPVDFSDTSKNAAMYAVELAANLDEAKIILYNAYDEIVSGDDGTPLYNDEDSRKNLSLLALANVKDSLPQSDKITITCEAEIGTAVKNLNKFSIMNDADLIIMGINGATKLEQVMIGSTTLNVVHNVRTPVMIIPPDARYTGMKNVTLTSDFKDVANTTPFVALKELLDLLKAKLHIVNVDEEHYVEEAPEYKRERLVLQKQLGTHNPEFYFLRAFDFIEGINRFVTDRNMDALITIPKKHNFLSNLFKTSHTKKLAYHLHIPIIALHV